MGLFSAFIPVPSQMLQAAIIAIYFRVNLPISVALVWITNPITIPPMIYGSYRVGAWVLGNDVTELQVELSLDWVLANFVAIGKPLFVGSVICGLIAGSIGFTASHFIWRNRVMRQWRKRRRLRGEEPR